MTLGYKFTFIPAFIVLMFTIDGQKLPLPAPEILTKEVSVFSGSFSAPIYSINADTFGFIYLSTDKGLYRYNGFQLHKITDEESLNPSFNSITFLKNGRVIAINFYEGLFEVIKNSLVKIDILGIKNEKYTFLNLVEHGEKLYLLTDKSLFILNEYFDILSKIEPDIQNSKFKEFSQIITHKNIVYILTKGNLIYKIFSNGKHEVFDMPLTCQWVATSDEKNLYFTCRDVKSDIFTFDGKFYHKDFDYYINPFVSIYRIKKIGDQFFLCTSTGLYLYDPKEKVTKKIISDKKISDIMNDQVGNYWATSIDGKLITWKSDKFKSLTIPISEEIAYARKIDDKKFLFVTIQNNFYIIDFKSNQIEHLGQFGNEDIKFLEFSEHEQAVYFKYGKLDLNTRTYVSMYLGNNMVTMPTGERYYLIKDKVYYQEANQDCMTGTQASKFSECLRLLHESRAKKVIWVDSSAYILSLSGLLKHKGNKLSEVIDKSRGIRIKGLDIAADSDNKYWVATTHSRIDIYHFDFHQKSLDLNYIFPEYYSIIKLKYFKPFILVILSNGVLLIDQITYEIIDISDMFNASEIQVGDVIVEDDIIYFFSGKKIITGNIKSEGITLTKIYVKGITDLKSKVYDRSKNPIRLKNNSFFLEFDYLSLGKTGGIRVAYRVKDIDTNWNFIMADANKIFFPYMKSGIHLLELSIVDQTGKIISNTASIKVDIPKPFYNSTYFFVILLLVMVFISGLIIYLNEQKAKKKEMIESQIRLSKLTALRSRMNPHFVYNILNSIQSLIYIGDKRSASNYLSKFSELMRKVLELSEKENLLLNEELHVIELYLELEKLRLGEDFKYTIEIDNELKYLNPEIPGFFIQPFVENAIKHGLLHKKDDKKLLIKVEMGTNNDLRIIIDDNGIGRKKADEINQRRKIKKTSFALEAIRNRIDLINSRLKRKIVLQIFDKVDLNNQPSGTTVILSFPIELYIET